MADGVQAKAYRPRRIAGLEVEDEALGPLLRLRLLRAANIGEIAAEVVVARLQGGRGILDETRFGLDETGADAGAEQYGKLARGVGHLVALVFIGTELPLAL
ncbi:hypothetical protein D9M70_556890 [compost metagenome]